MVHALPPAPAPVVRVSEPASAALSLDTPIWRICADPRGKAVLLRDMPGLMAHPAFAMFKGMSLHRLAVLAGGRLPQDRLQQVELDLARLPPGDSARLS